MTLKATIQKNLLFGFVWALIFVAVADRSLSKIIEEILKRIHTMRTTSEGTIICS